MTSYVALLRGINVSGQKLIKMTDLKQVFEALGLAKVQTYIQSGNVLFQAEEDAGALRRRMEAAIKTAFGFDVPVAVRTIAELEQVVANCPFAVEALAPGESLYVALLAEAPTQAGVEKLLAYKSDAQDEFRLAEPAIYILYRQSMRETKLTNNFFEKKLGVPMTTRNWNTTTTLVRMGKALEEL